MNISLHACGILSSKSYAYLNDIDLLMPLLICLPAFLPPGPAADRDPMAAVPVHHPGAGAPARTAQVPPPVLLRREGINLNN